MKSLPNLSKFLAYTSLAGITLVSSLTMPLKQASALLFEPSPGTLDIGKIYVREATENDGDDIYLKIYTQSNGTKTLVKKTPVKTMYSGSSYDFYLSSVEFTGDTIVVEVWDEDGGFRGGDDLLMKLEYYNQDDTLPAFISGEEPNWGEIDAEICTTSCHEERFLEFSRQLGSPQP